MVKRLLGVSVSLLLVAGCFSDGPSEAEAREAFHPTMSALYRTLCHGAYSPCKVSIEASLKSFKLVDCKAASGQPGYRCDFSWMHPQGMTETDQCRFFKQGDRWTCQPGT